MTMNWTDVDCSCVTVHCFYCHLRKVLLSLTPDSKTDTEVTMEYLGFAYNWLKMSALSYLGQNVQKACKKTRMTSNNLKSGSKMVMKKKKYHWWDFSNISLSKHWRLSLRAYSNTAKRRGPAAMTSHMAHCNQSEWNLAGHRISSI